jgi:hypothetical protein
VQWSDRAFAASAKFARDLEWVVFIINKALASSLIRDLDFAE